MMFNRVVALFIVTISASCVAGGFTEARISKHDLVLQRYTRENADQSVWSTPENYEANSGASGNPQGRPLYKYTSDDQYTEAMVQTDVNTEPGYYYEQSDYSRPYDRPPVTYNPIKNGQRGSYNEPINRQPQDYHQGSNRQPGPNYGQTGTYNRQPVPNGRTDNISPYDRQSENYNPSNNGQPGRYNEATYRWPEDHHDEGSNGEPGIFITSSDGQRVVAFNIPYNQPTTKNGPKPVSSYVISNCPDCEPATSIIHIANVTSDNQQVHLNVFQATGGPSSNVSPFANSYPNPAPDSTNFYRGLPRNGNTGQTLAKPCGWYDNIYCNQAPFPSKPSRQITDLKNISSGGGAVVITTNQSG